jgi:predicted regulator of amino acid metabolism with ACT domain
MNPLTDAELEDKFSEMAVKHMSNGHIQKIFETIWSLEKLDDIAMLTGLMVVKPQHLNKGMQR